MERVGCATVVAGGVMDYRVTDPEARSSQVFGCLPSRSKSGSQDGRVRRRDSVDQEDTFVGPEDIGEGCVLIGWMYPKNFAFPCRKYGRKSAYRRPTGSMCKHVSFL